MFESPLLRRLVPAFAAALLGVPLAAGAEDASVTRSVSGFDRIKLTGAFTADIKAGEAARFVMTGDRSLLDRVTTEVRDRTLIVGMRPGTGPFGNSPKLEIGLPVLRSFSNEGAGSMKISGLTGGELAIENAGAATIVAAGRATRESISLDGTGKIDVSAVEARDVTVDNNGVGSVRVRASGTLTMNVNGVGEIRYAGKPTHVESNVNGVGRIGRL
ncbi:MAG: DUF2807 domain-containing protein [Candidatus Eremiobacteraeota bacterium]|nr:DUF2807 domain-containing protein [Candidatus Eremiobacteraeota bacterium]